MAVTNGQERNRFGCLTTWENGEGKTITLLRTGPMKEALSHAAECVLMLDPTFRLVAYSTPETIYSDLIGARADNQLQAGSNGWSHGKTRARPLSEQMALGRIGRPDLLHPRLAQRGRDFRA